MLTKFSNNWWIKTKENCYTTSKQKKNEITDFLAKQKHNVFWKLWFKIQNKLFCKNIKHTTEYFIIINKKGN